jgi:hypothetical protein
MAPIVVVIVITHEFKDVEFVWRSSLERERVHDCHGCVYPIVRWGFHSVL